MKPFPWLVLVVLLMLPFFVHGDSEWKFRVPENENDFPIAVWLQDPKNAERYRAAGVNVYVALWKGPTEEQLNRLQKAGMRLICNQNEVGLAHRESPTIVGWMHGDEPDNAQSLGAGKGYGPPIAASKIIEDYKKLKRADGSRPILLNLGQGVAWDKWIGRGVRRNHPEDYEEYVKGADIVSFDIYPAVHDSPEVAGKLEFVGRGVERLKKWTQGKKQVWCCIEASRISNVRVKPTVEQVRADVWIALIHGANGLIYFVHQFKPVFREASLLDDPELLAGITKINAQVKQLAPALHAPDETHVVELESGKGGAVAWTLKRLGEKLYLFVVNESGEPASQSFKLREELGAARGEIPMHDLAGLKNEVMRAGRWSVDLAPYEVRLLDFELGHLGKAGRAKK